MKFNPLSLFGLTESDGHFKVKPYYRISICYQYPLVGEILTKYYGGWIIGRGDFKEWILVGQKAQILLKNLNYI